MSEWYRNNQYHRGVNFADFRYSPGENRNPDQGPNSESIIQTYCYECGEQIALEVPWKLKKRWDAGDQQVRDQLESSLCSKCNKGQAKENRSVKNIILELNKTASTSGPRKSATVNKKDKNYHIEKKRYNHSKPSPAAITISRLPKKIHDCPVCQEIFGNFDALASHVFLKHRAHCTTFIKNPKVVEYLKSRDLEFCEQCGATCKNLEKHQKKVHKDDETRLSGISFTSGDVIEQTKRRKAGVARFEIAAISAAKTLALIQKALSNNRKALDRMTVIEELDERKIEIIDDYLKVLLARIQKAQGR